MVRSSACCLSLIALLALWLQPQPGRAEESAESPQKKAPPPAEKPTPSPEKPVDPGQQKPVPPDLGQGLRQIGPGQFELKRDEMVRLMFNAPFISRQLWVREVKRDGKLVGYKLKHIKKGNLVHRAGFRNGDVVTRINGQRLTAPESLLLTIGASDQIQVQLYRAGKLRKHVYHVVP